MSRSLGSSAVSPDGKQIAFLSRGDVFVTATDYTTTRQITKGLTGRARCQLRRGNKSVVYASTKDGSWISTSLRSSVAKIRTSQRHGYQ